MKNPDLSTLLELINHYPSPHNGQPIRMKWLNDSECELYFARERGLQATDISFIFSFVSMGVFVEHMRLAGRALGHEVKITLALPAEDDLKGDGVIQFANAVVSWNTQPPDSAMYDSLIFRQTSRNNYTESPDSMLIEDIVSGSNEKFTIRALDERQSHKAIWLNQRAVFDDMFDPAVRSELRHWLRFTKSEKNTKMDGLSYDCMNIDGNVMKYIIDHPGLLRAPLIAPLLEQYYLRTMKDKSTVLYMCAPFQTERQSYDVGVKIMEVWSKVSEVRHYLHPFGTIMSNAAAHADFVKLANIKEKRDANYLVFIFRLGVSEPPVKSCRIPYEKHLIME